MTARTYHPRETSFNRCGVFVEVLAVQTHASLEAQTVTSTETSELHWGLREEFCDLYGL